MESLIVIPEPTKKRLIQMMQLLLQFDKTRITSLEISELTGWKDSLIRHDLWLVGYNKGISNGYKVSDLLDSIRKILCVDSTLEDNKKNCCIVGLGRLGAALLDDDLFSESQFRIKAGFDSNINRIEILRSSFSLYPINNMANIIRQEKIIFAILCVKNKDAQNITNKLIDAKIEGIVNLTEVIVKVPSGIKVENISIINALQLLK
ncbi:MAG: redox-sensing transcriptional repressor Rex [Treponema sp.]|jgi:redox-sensing transcriptional repressor|nr:redox-sensing transcriptional repressor Rex [Treponema sp.]